MSELDPEVREIRLAVVMTGGVSLAVWIGGVAAEIHRAVSGVGLYGALCRETRSDVVLDVITGASAGGVNGAFLATATAYELDESNFDQLRNVWRVSGGFENLLRKPKEKNPPSLLQGDAYFLGELMRELECWVAMRKPGHAVADDALRLVMTTTTLRPDERRFRDDLGSTIVEPVHRGQFEFTGRDFDANQGNQLAAKLALAARASASFPGAFEPAFIPIGTTLQRDGVPTLPDMAGVASFAESRWVVDGGVLVNKPVGPALEAIKSRSASREVRRVMLYVNPDPGDAAPINDLGDRDGVMPTMASVVVKSLISLPRTESVAADLASITSHNRRLSQQRHTRTALLVGLRVRDSGAPGDSSAQGPWRVDLIDLVALGRQLYPIWLRQRAYSSVARRLELLGGRDPTGAVQAAMYTWEEFADAMRFARGEEGWLSSEFPDATRAPATSPALGDPTAPTVLGSSREWRFGLEPLEYLASTVLNLIGRAYSLLPISAPTGLTDAPSVSVARQLREQLGQLRERIHRQRKLVALLRRADSEFWGAELTRQPWPEGPIVERAEAILTAWPLASVGRVSDADTVPARRQREVWARLAILFREANTATAAEWEAATLRVLETPVGTDSLSDEQIEEPLGEPAIEDRPRRAALAFRRAEMAIGRQLTQILMDGAPLFYDACDHDPAMAGWRQAVADDWAATPPGEEERHWNHPAIPGIDGWLGAQLIDFAPQRPGAFLAAEVIRLTRIAPTTASAGPGARAWDEVLQLVLALHIVHTMADAGLDGQEVRIDFIQVSADNPTPLSPGGGALAKVAGLQLGHFGGFMKESWRANDWMWGALDGASHLVAVLVDLARLKQRYLTPDEAAQRLSAIARGVDPVTGKPFVELTADDLAYLDGIVPEAEITTELTTAWGNTGQPNLSVTRQTLAKTAQLIAARRELVAVGDAIRASGDARANESVEASRFLALVQPYLPPPRPAPTRGAPAPVPPPPPPIPMAKVESLVRRCPIGRERVADEYGSDRLTATAAQAAAVAGNLLAGNKVGTGALRRPMVTARYGLRGLYYLATSALRDTKTEAAFRNMLLAVAGVIVAVAVLGVDLPKVFVIAAVVTLGGWFVLTARSVRGMRGVVASIPLLLVLAFVAVMAIQEGDIKNVFTDAGAARWRGPVLVVGVAIAGLGFVVEAIRSAVGRKIAHLWHATVWAVAGLVWWGLWFVLFNGPYSGPRRWIVDRLEDIHRVRLVILIAVPAALIAYDLTRTWLSQSDRARRRQMAAVEVHGDTGASSEVAELRRRLRELEQVIDLRGAPDAAPEPSAADVREHAP